MFTAYISVCNFYSRLVLMLAMSALVRVRSMFEFQVGQLIKFSLYLLGTIQILRYHWTGWVGSGNFDLQKVPKFVDRWSSFF